MQLDQHYQLTYCTNIHPGEDWNTVMETLYTYIPPVKQVLSPEAPFGIGLRLSRQAADQLMNAHCLATFKNWLTAHNCYVFTMNGFPYGGFHRQRVKDDVHQPDWTTTERYEYTRNLFYILTELLPEGMDGGISTSPLSYKHWHKSASELDVVMEKSLDHLVQIAVQLHEIRQKSGHLLHLDIEPEPDGLLEDTQTTLDFYKNWLIPQGVKILEKKGMSVEQAEECLREHIRLCYDVCHFAVMNESPESVLQKFASEDIRIGKVQISAALKAILPDSNRKAKEAAFRQFAESTYLHQVVAIDQQGNRRQYPDLPQALEEIHKPEIREWRTHFHVPVFLENYGELQSTQDDVIRTLNYLKTHHPTHHLEVETYTWEVLPEDIRLEMADSIVRELEWVRENFIEA
ncbi:metabolite traffic protein EboE [Catalinimonas niigatensis]|uniref:metabolite traffic protein EboE n=1 Tax=Catalinimonas niigatensis TaxID=1397264 RepID=UPI002665F5D4|nr:metabolite traffic protein EboE [Catalinimonas niigatensis]WPP53581.1 metabolite traffic protein EboE [Catalinimonas niigatensis]